MSAPRTFAVTTYGCQMNAYDSERIGELLREAGHVPAADPGTADIQVLNTCHIREKAAEKVYSEIGRIRHAADTVGRPRPLIAVAGCVAQAEGTEIVRRAKVDVVAGPLVYDRLPALIAAAAGVVDTDMPATQKFARLPARRRVSPPSAFLTVQEGCDKFCTFCVVPYTRGPEVSRTVAELVAEARELVAGGARELVLLGQNVNAFHGVDEAGATVGLAGLIRRLAALPGLLRLRYTTSHPRDVGDDLIAAHAEVPALMPYLHLPVQSGSDAVLRRMNRAHTAPSYLELLERVRTARPGIALSGDFIVGFPGESEADFAATLRLVEQVGYAAAYSFKYSPRPGTPAAEHADQVAEPVKAERLARLQAAITAGALAFNRGHVGQVVEVLLERPGKHAGQLLGKSPWLQSVAVDAAGLAVGDIVPVLVTGATASGLTGTVAADLRVAA